MLKKIAVFGLNQTEYYLCEIYTLDDAKNIALPENLIAKLPPLTLRDGHLCDDTDACFDFLVIDTEDIEIFETA